VPYHASNHLDKQNLSKSQKNKQTNKQTHFNCIVCPNPMKPKPVMTGHRAHYEGGKEGREGRREGKQRPVTAALPGTASARHQQILIPMPPPGVRVSSPPQGSMPTKTRQIARLGKYFRPETSPKHFLAFAAQQASPPPEGKAAYYFEPQGIQGRAVYFPEPPPRSIIRTPPVDAH
jgi:hypothetical protein